MENTASSPLSQPPQSHPEILPLWHFATTVQTLAERSNCAGVRMTLRVRQLWAGFIDGKGNQTEFRGFSHN